MIDKTSVKPNDILWTMVGTRQNDNIHWKAIPRMVEDIEQYMIRFYSGGGISFNGVGSIFFTSKEECEQHWKEHHAIDELIGFEDPTPEGINEYPRTDWETYEVQLFNGVDATAVYKGGLTELVNITNELQWHEDTEHVEFYGDIIKYLELQEISEQVNSALITVIVNGPLEAKVFQYGNYSDTGWVYLGGIQGYA